MGYAKPFRVEEERMATPARWVELKEADLGFCFSHSAQGDSHRNWHSLTFPPLIRSLPA